MKKIFAILALVGVVATGVSQNITKAGLYDSKGNLVEQANEPIVLSVTLRVATESFTPGVYARYAQKYLGQRATLANHSTIELLDGTLALGAVKSEPVQVEVEAEEIPLSLNRMSAEAKTDDEQAAAAANLIFSLRKHRLELITGEAGENVFGAGLKAALDEISRHEMACLDMFYGSKSVSVKSYTFNIEVTPQKSEYIVCRFNEKTGIVDADDLSGTPIVVKVEKCQEQNYSRLQPVEVADKHSAEYTIVPNVKCSLIGEAKLLDAVLFASPLYAKKVLSIRIK